MAAVRRAHPSLTLKLILESGELRDESLIAAAATMALDEGVDFLKTSTGKTTTGATLEAADVMLRCIAQDRSAAARVGFKASGGVRTAEDAVKMAQAGANRIGASASVAIVTGTATTSKGY